MIQMRIAVVVMMLFLVGCSSVTQSPQVLSLSEKEKLWQQHRQQLEAYDEWSMTGRLGLQVPDRSGSMSIEWQQSPAQYTIYLDGPFGQSLAWIQGNEKGVSARVSDDEVISGSSPEYLLRKLTGWNFPVSSLKFWVKGLPAPDGEADIALNNFGYPKQIRQQGWQVDYLTYRNQGASKLPARIKASNGHVRMTLVVRSWQLP